MFPLSTKIPDHRTELLQITLTIGSMFEFGGGPIMRSSIKSSRAEADVKYITKATLQGASEFEGGHSGLLGKYKLANPMKNDRMKTSHSRSSLVSSEQERNSLS